MVNRGGGIRGKGKHKILNISKMKRAILVKQKAFVTVFLVLSFDEIYRNRRYKL